MKRLTAFVFMAVLVCSAYPAECAVFARPNPDFVEWRMRQAQDCGSGAAGTASPGASRSAARGASDDGMEADGFPSAYDMRDYGFLPPIRNQGALGVCWAFSSSASMESNLLKKGLGGYDLS